MSNVFSLKPGGCHFNPHFRLRSFLCLVLLLFLPCPFSAKYLSSWRFFSGQFSSTFRLEIGCFCVTLVEQLGDDSWSMVCSLLPFVFVCFWFCLFVCLLTVLCWTQYHRALCCFRSSITVLCAISNHCSVSDSPLASFRHSTTVPPCCFRPSITVLCAVSDPVSRSLVLFQTQYHGPSAVSNPVSHSPVLIQTQYHSPLCCFT